jgi:prolyl 4-hydroxylase
MREFDKLKADSFTPHLEAVQENRGVISLQLYNDECCRRILEASRSARGWQSATIHTAEKIAAVHTEYRSAESLIPKHDSNLRRELDQKIEHVIRPLVKQAWKVDLPDHRDTHLVRYSPGGFYVPHVDLVPGDVERYFTVLCYLNDDFEGGRTTFPMMNFSVIPEAGKAILFPSTYLHCAEPVARGEKYIFVSWLTGPPPINWLQ